MALRQRGSNSTTIAFNKKNIKALQPKDKRYRAWDSEVRGFCIVVFPSGVKSYRLRYRLKNDVLAKTHDLTLGDVLDYPDPDTVRQIAREKKMLIDKGLNPKVMITETQGKDYFTDLADEWLDSTYFTDLAETSQKNFKLRLKAHLIPKFKTFRVKDITVQQVRKYYEEGINKHSSNVANSNHRLLSSIMTFAKDKDYIDINPCINAIPKKLKQDDSRRYFEIDHKMLRKVHKGITLFGESQYGNPYSYFLFRCVQLLGFRPSEIVTLRWSKDNNLKKLQNYVDLERRVFVYEKIKNWNMIKKKRPKILAIPDYIFELLKKLPRAEGNPYVLPSLNIKGDHYKKYDKSWDRVTKLGNFKLALRDLRPVHLTLSSYEFGVEKTSKYIGHSSEKMTEYYIKAIPKKDREFANVFFDNALKEYSQ